MIKFSTSDIYMFLSDPVQMSGELQAVLKLRRQNTYIEPISDKIKGKDLKTIGQSGSVGWSV